jgi:hypothetical protein
MRERTPTPNSPLPATPLGSGAIKVFPKDGE